MKEYICTCSVMSAGDFDEGRVHVWQIMAVTGFTRKNIRHIAGHIRINDP